MHGQGKEQVSQADPARQGGVGVFQLNDLRKGLKTLLKPGCSMVFSNKTVYVLAWAGSNAIHGDISNHFWASPQITAAMVSQTLNRRSFADVSGILRNIEGSEFRVLGSGKHLFGQFDHADSESRVRFGFQGQQTGFRVNFECHVSETFDGLTGAQW